MNEKRGVPKAFNGHLVKSKFPLVRPIFWAGQQDTLFPGPYIEPAALKNNLMKIPLAVRFIVGGGAAEVNIDRLIYLGYAKLQRMAIVFSDTECSHISIALGGFYGKKAAVTVVHEIGSEFSANLTTLQAINLFTEITSCVKEDYGLGPFFINLNEFGQFTWNPTKFTYTCGIDPTPHTAPGFDPWVSGAIDIGADPIPVASPFTSAVATPNTLFTYAGALNSVHYFLHNYINNSIQTNRIYIYINMATDVALTSPESITLSDLSFGHNAPTLELEP
jgi:hypothetical protein